MSSHTCFVNAIDLAIANNEIITALLLEAQLGALFHRARFAAIQHEFKTAVEAQAKQPIQHLLGSQAA